MEQLVVYGKGGIGKSTIAANLSAVYGRRGLRTLHVGCDPKHDSSMLLIGRRKVTTVLNELFHAPGRSLRKEHFVMPGVYGIDCIEAGGPEPGVGCGGRGITRMFEVLDDLKLLKNGDYDLALFDVLGDVVCGGFAAPLRAGLAQKIVIVTSEEMMSLYAANNICRAIRRHEANGIYLVGLVANIRDSASDDSRVRAFADRVGTRVLAVVHRDPVFRLAEARRVPLNALEPEPPLVRAFETLADVILAARKDLCPSPKPLDDEQFDQFIDEGFQES